MYSTINTRMSHKTQDISRETRNPECIGSPRMPQDTRGCSLHTDAPWCNTQIKYNTSAIYYMFIYWRLQYTSIHHALSLWQSREILLYKSTISCIVRRVANPMLLINESIACVHWTMCPIDANMFPCNGCILALLYTQYIKAKKVYTKCIQMLCDASFAMRKRYSMFAQYSKCWTYTRTVAHVHGKMSLHKATLYLALVIIIIITTTHALS
jgi:hypothetical protein